MTPLTRLPAEDRATLRRLVAQERLLALYLDLAEAEAARGADASLVRVGRARRGAVLGVRFDGLTVFSTLGELAAEELEALARWPGPVELHLPEPHRAPLLGRAGARVARLRTMVAMGARTAGAAPEAGVEVLEAAHFAEAAALMAAHHPATVLSARMAGLPFAAVRERGRIVALAGTIGIAGRAGLLGHFLTLPEARGRGLARRLARHLLHRLGALGVAEAMLATTEENAAACRAYAAAGFVEVARRWQVELAG